MTTLLPALIVCMLPLTAMAQEGVRITDGHARGANPKSGAAYMVIRNDGDRACTLSGVETDAAARAELHTSREENGLMRMVRTGPVPIPPGASHELAPGRDHVMLMGLKTPLRDGAELALTLDLGACGRLDVTVPVVNTRLPARGD
ncbi:hypothetical protein SAMN04487972_102262 [Paracoccus halophilus]|uniref:Copper chaperone PCu(A)C n=1 Tax=Paracoccus halophilus TaxID=376733 RepID=A0A1I0STT8_9RHOB|nr:copper chaperone PCu(A)C [Paracoccus halophilus]SFA42176.1 hypothetical protein SAMN04487972_102262 [Paracoccus halophilus]